ncbi:MgtC/SapB family protein [Fictibacillus sp. Mic-4]|uniref:MgtC/SapB family protein n=1 Tax=Fictibacillus TaxID=1329200 RepID=UPI00041A62D2|nr:MgtC/SapB family protein [Fictibacillus gelatini]
MAYELILRLVIAGVLGAIIGFERKSRLKEAGLRTHFLVAVGSALIMVVSKYGFFDLINDHISLDPSRVAAQVVSGIGFLGAGTIIVQRQNVRGLTTAAGLWATSGIGLTIGAGMYWVGISATILVFFGLELLDKGLTFFLPEPLRLRLFLEDRPKTIRNVLNHLADEKIKIASYQIELPHGDSERSDIVLELILKVPASSKKSMDILEVVRALPGVTSARVE